MAYALRRYNVKFDEANAGQRIILQNVLEDWASMRYDLPIERTAAVIHLQTALMASRLLHGWVSKLSESPNFRTQCKEIRGQLKDVKMCLDLRKDIWEIGGYNISAADSGTFDAIEERNRTFGCIHDYTTTTAASQVAQGAGEIEHIKDWNVPLMPRDGRRPPAQFKPPVWDPHPIVMMTAEAFQKEEESELRNHNRKLAQPVPPEAQRHLRRRDQLLHLHLKDKTKVNIKNDHGQSRDLRGLSNQASFRTGSQEHLLQGTKFKRSETLILGILFSQQK